MRKKISILLTFAIIVSMFSFMTLTTSATTSGDYTYIIENGCATITNYSGSVQKLTIPETLDGYPVTKIGRDAFFNNYFLQEVYLPNNLLYIGDQAFAKSFNLRYVSFGNNLETIKYGAFNTCPLISISLPNSLTTLENAFINCNLSFAYIPHSIDYIDNAFSGNPNLIIIGCAGSYAETYANDKGITFATTPCKNHLFIQGECSCCEILLGDLNGDGVRDTSDYMLLSGYVANPATCPDLEIADINQNGVLDENDKTILLEIILGIYVWPQ